MFRSHPSGPPVFASRRWTDGIFIRTQQISSEYISPCLSFHDSWDMGACDPSWLFLPLLPGLLLISNSASLLSAPSENPSPLGFSYFHHLLQPAVHLRLIHLTLPQVTDALRNDHTAERTKDNITSRNWERNTTSTLRRGCPDGHSTINLSQVKKKRKNNCKEKEYDTIKGPKVFVLLQL